MGRLPAGLVCRDGFAHGSRILGSKRMQAEEVAPRRISRASLVNNYLCMGRHSPCHRCEVLCHYGKLYLRMQRKGAKEHG